MSRLRKPRILVIGSALLDTVAERTIEQPWSENASAKIITSIGGSSYNIAVNLALERPRAGIVGLFSYLPPKTTTTEIILRRLKQLGVSTRYVRRKESVNNNTITAGGFVAIRDQISKQLFICGVEEIMGEHDLTVDPEEQVLLDDALAGCKAVVVDTGLNPAAMAHVMGMAARKSVPVFIHIVSVQKASNYVQALKNVNAVETSQPVVCIMGKPAELDALHKGLGASTGDGEIFSERYVNSDAVPDDVAGFDVGGICRKLGTRHILITPRSIEDAYLLTAEPAGQQRVVHGLGLPETGKGSLLGVAEAIGAAIIHHFCRQARRLRARHVIDSGKLATELNRTAHRFGQRVIGSMGGTPLAVISREADLVALPFSVRLRRWSDMAYAAMNIISVVWFAVTLGALLVGFKLYHPKLGGPIGP